MEQALEKCRNYDTEVTQSCKVLFTLATCSTNCPSFVPTYEYARQMNPKLAQTPPETPKSEPEPAIEEGGVASGEAELSEEAKDAERRFRISF